MPINPRTYPSLRRGTTRQTARILGLLAAGETVDRIAARGHVEGWTRARVLAVIAEHGWALDAAGRPTRRGAA